MKVGIVRKQNPALVAKPVLPAELLNAVPPAGSNDLEVLQFGGDGREGAPVDRSVFFQGPDRLPPPSCQTPVKRLREVLQAVSLRP